VIRAESESLLKFFSISPTVPLPNKYC